MNPAGVSRPPFVDRPDVGHEPDRVPFLDRSDERIDEDEGIAHQHVIRMVECGPREFASHRDEFRRHRRGPPRTREEPRATDDRPRIRHLEDAAHAEDVELPTVGGEPHATTGDLLEVGRIDVVAEVGPADVPPERHAVAAAIPPAHETAKLFQAAVDIHGTAGTRRALSEFEGQKGAAEGSRGTAGVRCRSFAARRTPDAAGAPRILDQRRSDAFLEGNPPVLPLELDRDSQPDELSMLAHAS